MKTIDTASVAVSPVAPAGASVSAGAKVAQESQMAAAVEKMAQAPAPQDLNAAVKAAAHQIDSYLKSVGRQVEFRVDDDTGVTVVTVRETATGEVIRQIPNEEVLQMARHFDAGSKSLLDLTV